MNNLVMSFDYGVEHFSYADGVLSRVDGLPVNIYFNKEGYGWVTKGRNQTSVHRLVFWLTNGFDPEEIDHIDRDTRNNNPDNLRACTRANNCRNIGITKACTSGYKGVTWHKRANKWMAQIKFNHKKYYLGVHKDILDAAKAYDKKAIELHGEFAVTNKMLMRY